MYNVSSGLELFGIENNTYVKKAIDSGYVILIH